jgi:hypothetical protein
MSLKGRLEKLESALGSQDICRCEKRIRILEQGESLPDDSLCEL